MGNISCHTQLFVYTHIDNNRYPGWNLCPHGYFPLDGTPFHLASARGQWLRIHYRGNKLPNQTTGFSASYAFREPGCSGTDNLTGSPWWFASHPGAGSWPVEAGSRCSWTLTAPAGQFPALVAGKVDLHCVAGWQTIDVYDGVQPTNNSLIVILTCTDQVSPLAATGRHLHLRYTDRWASHSLGFNISFQFYQRRQSGCGSDYLLASPAGHLESFRLAGVSTYTPLSRCRWRLVAPPGVQLVLKFLTFDVTSRYTDGSCSRDLLVLQERSNESTSGVHVFCNGRSAPPPLMAFTQHPVEIFFATEGLSREYGQGVGFLLNYSRVCPTPFLKSNVVWSSPDENQDGSFIVTPGESVHYECREGFMVTSGSTRRECREDGNMSGVEVVCHIVTCRDVPSPRFTSQQILDLNMDGINLITYKDVITYACVTGYTPISGDTHRACQANGTLSGEDLLCGVKQCPVFPAVQNATAMPIDSQENGQDVITFGEVVLYTCFHGYQEVRGSSVRRCQEDGVYSGEDLVCSPRSCGPVPELRGAFIVRADDINSDGTQVSHPETVQFACLAGYTPTSGHQLRSCTAGGKLNGTDLVCEPAISCEWQDEGGALLAATWENTTPSDGGANVSYGHVATFSCRPGYLPAGGDTFRVCQEDGTFNGTRLQCLLATGTNKTLKGQWLSRPTVIGTGVCAAFFILMLVLLVSLLSTRGRRQRDARISRDRRSPDLLASKSPPVPHHALTLHRVATPWDGLPSSGGYLELNTAPETLRRPGAPHFRWPMYMWNEPVPCASQVTRSRNAATMFSTKRDERENAGRNHVTLPRQSGTSRGTAMPLAC